MKGLKYDVHALQRRALQNILENQKFTLPYHIYVIHIEKIQHSRIVEDC